MLNRIDVQNDPVNWVDPEGLRKDPTCVNTYTVGGSIIGGGIGYFGGGILGGGGGTLVAPGVGTVGGTIAGSEAGGAAGAAAGATAGNLIGQEVCPDENPCPELYRQIDEHINRNKHLYGGGGTHGLRWRFAEQITGAYGPGTTEWDNHDSEIRKTQASLQRLLNSWEQEGCSAKGHSLPVGAYDWATRNPPTPEDWVGPGN